MAILPSCAADSRAVTWSVASASWRSSRPILTGRGGASVRLLVLLGGESGVGKTRLVREFEQRHAEDAIVLRGEAVEQGDAQLPYAPLLGALRPLVRACHPVLKELGKGSRSQLAALVPGLDDGVEVSERHDPAAQLRLFEAVLELVDLLGETQPAVLILEDMHWADRSTRTFVAFLARSLREERVMMLLTYRSDELHRRHALRPLLSELERLPSARRLELVPFDRVELTEALADTSATRPPTSSSTGCSRAARATRCTPRSCWPPVSTAVVPLLRVCAMRSCCGSSACPSRANGRRARSPSGARRRGHDRRHHRDRPRGAAYRAARGCRRAGAGGLR